jgi:hypothetical protein
MIGMVGAIIDASKMTTGFVNGFDQVTMDFIEFMQIDKVSGNTGLIGDNIYGISISGQFTNGRKASGNKNKFRQVFYIA